MAIAQMKDGPVTYTGFEEKDNGKFFLLEDGDYIRLKYQVNEFTQALCNIKKLYMGNLKEQFDHGYLHGWDIPKSIMEHIEHGETVYWYWGDPLNGPLNLFGTDLDKIIETQKEKMLKEYSK